MTLLTMRGTLMAPATGPMPGCTGRATGLLEWRWKHPLPRWRRWRRPARQNAVGFLLGGESTVPAGKKTTHKGFWLPNDPMSMILGYFGFQVKVEYSGITFYNSIYYSPTTTPLSYCLCFIELGVLWLPGVPFLSGKSNTNVNYLLEECLQLQGFLLVALLAGSHWDGIELDSMILQDSPRLYCVLPSGKHTKNYGKWSCLIGKSTINSHFQ